MSDGPIVAYERPPHVDVVQELRTLGPSCITAFFGYWQRIVAGDVDHWECAPFDQYEGVPIYKAEIGNRFAIYSVEEEKDGGTKVSVLLAATRGDRSIGGYVWDGQDMKFVLDMVVRPRAADYFK